METRIKNIAQKHLEEFIYSAPELYQDGNLLMAYYASFSGVFTPDMLFQLLATFNSYQLEKEEVQHQIHYMSISDLLLSDLCTEISHELFEMDEDVQKYLQGFPIELNKFSFPSKHRASLAAFIYQYAQKFYNHPFRRNIKDVLYWKALTILSPDFTVSKIAETLKKFDKDKKASIEEVQLLLQVANLEETLNDSEDKELVFSKYPSVSDVLDEKTFIKKISHPAITKLFGNNKKVLATNNQVLISKIKSLIEDRNYRYYMTSQALGLIDVFLKETNATEEVNARLKEAYKNLEEYSSYNKNNNKEPIPWKSLTEWKVLNKFFEFILGYLPKQPHNKGLNIPNKVILNPREELKQLIGLKSPKREIENHFALFQRLKDRDNLFSLSKIASFHLAFSGNTGTGKTTLGNLVGKIYKEDELLKKGHFVSVSASELVGKTLLESLENTENWCKKAVDGVLLIDHINFLINNKFGPEICAKLLEYMNNFQDSLCIIFSDTKNEIGHFLKKFPKINAKIASEIDFFDYTPNELYQIFELHANQRNLSLSNNLKNEVKRIIEDRYKNKQTLFYNGLFPLRILQKLIKNHAQRCTKNNLPVEDTIIDIVDLAKEYKSNVTNGEYIIFIKKNNKKSQVYGISSVLNANDSSSIYITFKDHKKDFVLGDRLKENTRNYLKISSTKNGWSIKHEYELFFASNRCTLNGLRLNNENTKLKNNDIILIKGGSIRFLKLNKDNLIKYKIHLNTKYNFSKSLIHFLEKNNFNSRIGNFSTNSSLLNYESIQLLESIKKMGLLNRIFKIPSEKISYHDDFENELSIKVSRTEELTKISFEDLNLPDADFSSLIIKDCVFDNAYLENANFSKARILDTSFINTELREGIFKRAEIIDTFFNKSFLSNTSFQGAKITDSLFEDTDLTDSNFTDATLKDCSFNGASLTGANLQNSVNGYEIIRKLKNRLIEEDISLKQFRELNNTFIGALHFLTSKDALEVLDTFIRYANSRIALGQSEFRIAAFEILKLGVEKRIFISDGIFVEDKFHIIVAFGSSLSNFKWTQNFITEYREYLTDGVNGLEYQSSKAIYHFFFGKKENQIVELEKSIEILRELKDNKNFVYFFRTRFNLIRSLYELFIRKFDKSIENEIVSNIDSFYQYLRRESSISQQQSAKLINAINTIKWLTSSRYDNEVTLNNKTIIRISNIKKSALHNRPWIEEKLEEFSRFKQENFEERKIESSNKNQNKLIIIEGDLELANYLDRLLKFNEIAIVNKLIVDYSIGSFSLKRQEPNVKAAYLIEVALDSQNLKSLEGFKLVQTIKKQNPESLIIVYSGMMVKKEALKAGANYFFSKEPGYTKKDIKVIRSIFLNYFNKSKIERNRKEEIIHEPLEKSNLKWERQFWESIAKDLEKEEGSHPSTWKKNRIESHFLPKLTEKVTQICEHDKEKANLCGKKGNQVITSSYNTFWRYLQNESQKTGTPKARHIYAIYLGYDSFQDYCLQKKISLVGAEKTVDKLDKTQVDKSKNDISLFWKSIAKDLEKEEGSHPSTWKKNRTETHFLPKLSDRVTRLCREDRKKANLCRLFEKQVVTSSYNTFWKYLQNEPPETGVAKTRHIYAIYLGYKSFEDYCLKKDFISENYFEEEKLEGVELKYDYELYSLLTSNSKIEQDVGLEEWSSS